jgi:uncharacterized membrane protein
MTHQDTLTDLPKAGVSTDQLKVRDVRLRDILNALSEGFDDFKAHPTHLVLCVMIYPVVTLVAARIGAGHEVLPLVWPLFSGIALISPLIAMGLYEMSRRREKGLKVSVTDGFRVLRSPSIGAILVLSVVMIAIFLAWLISALWIYNLTFDGTVATSIGAFWTQVATTAKGAQLVVIGTAVGFLYALLVLCISVISFPLLLDRKVGALTAAKTSMRAVLTNPMSMGLWGLIIAVLLFLGCLPAFVGLAVVIPVLGHATWHLYRKVVE